MILRLQSSCQCGDCDFPTQEDFIIHVHNLEFQPHKSVIYFFWHRLTLYGENT
jgi:hypothetical protein